jgi:hypothetical protein
MMITSLIKKYLLRYETIIWLTPIAILLSWPQLFQNLFTKSDNSSSPFNFWPEQLIWLHISSDLMIGFAALAMTIFMA